VRANKRFGRGLLLAGGFGVAALAALACVTAAPQHAAAEFTLLGWLHHCCDGPACGGGAPCGEWEGTWYWLRSADQEQRTVNALFNRYCIRCHGVDGRGVWDMPDIPDFTNARWQACRSDDELARIILEGRGAVMPPFRGVLSLEEAYAMARFLRTFAGTPGSRPDLGKGEEKKGEEKKGEEKSGQGPEVGPRPREQAPAARPEAMQLLPPAPSVGVMWPAGVELPAGQRP
jgi:mono/diheme cytochrome c family protein